MLAGISAEYYVRLERGNLRGVSEDVLDGIARALQLDEAERNHLFDLARAANTSTSRRGARRTAQERVRPVVQRILDSLVGAPAFVRNERLDVLAANQLGEAFYAPLYDDPIRPVNSARFVFLNPKATDFFLDWDTIANDAVGILRAEAGRDPYDKRLSDLIGELSTRSDQFRGPLGSAQREAAPHGGQALPPPGRRRAHPRVRVARPARRSGPEAARLLGRARLTVSTGTRPARQLGIHTRGRGHRRARAALTMGIQRKEPTAKGSCTHRRANGTGTAPRPVTS